MQQKFYLEYQKEGYYKITSMYSKKSLTAKDGKITDGNSIVQYDYQELDSQKWILRDTHINGWIISSFVNPELSLSIHGNIENGSKLVLSKTVNSEKQMLYTYRVSKEEKPKENGIYKMAIGSNYSKALEVIGAGIEENTIVDIWNYRKWNATEILF